MKLNRRDFIKGLFLSAAALVLPKDGAAQAVEERRAYHQPLSAVHTDLVNTVDRGDIIELSHSGFEIITQRENGKLFIKKLQDGYITTLGVFDVSPQLPAPDSVTVSDDGIISLEFSGASFESDDSVLTVARRDGIFSADPYPIWRDI